MASKESFTWVVELSGEREMGDRAVKEEGWERILLSHQKQGNCRGKWEGTELHRKDMQLSTIQALMLWYFASLTAPFPASVALPTALGGLENKCPQKRDLIKENHLFKPHLFPKQQH